MEKHFLEQVKEQFKNTSKKTIVLYSLLALLLLCKILNIYTINLVIGESMYPTLKEKQLLIGSSIYKITDNITYGDVITIKYDKDCIIKRVVGLPGDVIKIEDNILYRNGEEVKEDYANFIYPSVKIDVKEIVLGNDEYFVLGDNRSVSRDSRVIGPIHKDDIISKILGDY